MKIAKLIVPCLLAVLAGCGGPSGNGFEGKWTQKTKEKPSSLIVHKEGEVFHIDYTYNSPQIDEYHTKKLEATAVSDSVLTLVGGMGSVNLRLQEGHIYFQDEEYIKAE